MAEHETIQARLKRSYGAASELGRWRSLREFQQEVARSAKGFPGEVKGTSYASVHSYLSDEDPAEPPLSFLRVAAQVLHVRETWLLTGEGQPTNDMELAVELGSEAIAARLDANRAPDELSALLEARLGVKVLPTGKAVVAYHWSRVRAGTSMPGFRRVESSEGLLERYVEAIVASVRALVGQDARERMVGEFTDLVIEVTPVVARFLSGGIPRGYPERTDDRKEESDG